jgi:hypothetical protein
LSLSSVTLCQSAGLSARRRWLNLRSIHVGYVMKEVALRWDLLRVLLFHPVSNIPPQLHTHLHAQVELTRRQTGETWEPSKRHCSLVNRGEFDRKVYSIFFRSLKGLEF